MSVWKRWIVVSAVAVAGVLAVAAAVAAAHGGPGRGGPKGAHAAALVAEAATQLAVTEARLTTAITNAAIARVDEAVADGDLESPDAADLKARARDNLGFAMRISRTRVVASNLDVTTTRLNNGFRAARKTLILARINEAVADGDLEADRAAELKQELEEAELPGYKPFALRGFGHPLGFRRR